MRDSTIQKTRGRLAKPLRIAIVSWVVALALPWPFLSASVPVECNCCCSHVVFHGDADESAPNCCAESSCGLETVVPVLVPAPPGTPVRLDLSELRAFTTPVVAPNSAYAWRPPQTSPVSDPPWLDGPGGRVARHIPVTVLRL